MSANIYWERVNPRPESLSAYAPSSFIEAMGRAGFGLPCVLGPGDYAQISAMAAVYSDRQHNPYEELAKIILDLPPDGKIRLWAEYC